MRKKRPPIFERSCFIRRCQHQQYQVLDSHTLSSKLKDKFGFVDKLGNVVAAPQFDSADSFSYQKVIELAEVKIGDRWGYINNRGKIVINPQFDNAYEFKDDGFAVVEADGFLGIIDEKGDYLVSPKYDEIEDAVTQERLSQIIMDALDRIIEASLYE